MKTLLEVLVLGSLLTGAASAQDPTKPELRPGISVQMAVANHAVVMRAADELQATVVSITAGGKLFVGIEPTTPAALVSLRAETIYVKADSRVPFQTVLTVLDALRGKSVVLLALPPANGDRAAIMPPYGIKLAVSR
jgi:hypothetical protein